MAAKPQVTSLPATPQEQQWGGDFGKEYSERNRFTCAELDTLHLTKYGITRTALNQRFLRDVAKNASILEVGCNLGNQLLLLEEMGFTNLHGIEINSEIVREAKARVPFAQIVEGSAIQIPYPTAHFDLVFTAGLLIHIAPSELAKVMSEIRRCSRTWIWGLEYYSPAMTEVSYRGHRNLLWKTNYGQEYLEDFPDLELALEQKLPYLSDGNVDAMFLLRRRREHSGR